MGDFRNIVAAAVAAPTHRSLHFSAISHLYEVMERALLEHGADPNEITFPDTVGRTAPDYTR